MKNYLILLLLAAAMLFSSCKKTPAPQPLAPVPDERQMNWHRMEFYAFVHFNMNTFTGMEWGTGGEDPALFNPTALDCRQWAKVCSDAGMKGIIITAKHHDGFCLWPSAYTEHSVKNSPWKEGKGDVVRELSEACSEYGLKFGVYLSPWDRNHSEYGRPEYIPYFRNQLRELLTSYGEVFEVWFDGANGGTGWYGGANENRVIDAKTYYEWPATYDIVRELQPGAVIFSDASDIRWVGNEEGWARPTNWSTINKNAFRESDMQNREILHSGEEGGTDWVPAEVDVSIRPGWYYHRSEDHKVKSLSELLNIYYESVGRNASLLLNLPVDDRGLVHEKDVEALMKLAEALKADFAVDLAAGRKVMASNVRGNARKFRASNVNDGNPQTYWATDDSVMQASLTLDFGKDLSFNRFMVQEFIPLGQRVKRFTVEALVDGTWQMIAEETTIGNKRILRIPETTARQVRFSVTDSRACPLISNLQLFLAPKVMEMPVISRDQEPFVTISAADPGTDIHFTTDGSELSASSARYDSPFVFNTKGEVGSF
ncbi:MAG: alpha-L-fucosidase [Bacteroidota bacterium]|jgi:alpha-L-fucosidase|nr:alpha-L-fucosidase [Prolixibacteraceae bacterium]MDI9564702.1 alpha-L-fucosidase [Bacteroidota bacterium]HOC87309.1 alpha-L-fucosidase [Prolixibacteraceae bacterium]HOG96392.1 alpha-L-fucosidase [Prolixibacteraceae bacterium]HPY28176.1 alpha-L-fucosidase [Prolixibacteraceae bacterium]